jgi:hypothetical protein
LLGRDVTWERGFSRVHDGLDDGWAGMGQGLTQHGLGLVRRYDGVASSPTGVGKGGEVSRYRLTPVALGT